MHPRFRLFEDGQEQVVKSCSSEDAPVSIGLVLDTSGSMGDKLNLMKKAAIQFVRAANPADEYFLVEFQSSPQVVLPFTADTDQLIESIGQIEAGGSTALFDAVHLAVNEMRRANHPRKALLIVSDGMNNTAGTRGGKRGGWYPRSIFLFTRSIFGNLNGMETDTQSSVETREFSKRFRPRPAAAPLAWLQGEARAGRSRGNDTPSPVS